MESVNSALKGAFVDMARGFFRVFGRVEMTVLLGFTVAAFNLDRIRSYRAKQAEQNEAPRPRAKRRRGIWADVITEPTAAVPAEGTDPPDERPASHLTGTGHLAVSGAPGEKSPCSRTDRRRSAAQLPDRIDPLTPRNPAGAIPDGVS